MIRFHLLVLVAACSLAGCAICASPYDCYYAAYGGSQPRSDMAFGRVASAFSGGESLPMNENTSPNGEHVTVTDPAGPALLPASPEGILLDEPATDFWWDGPAAVDAPMPTIDSTVPQPSEPTPAQPLPNPSPTARASDPLSIQLVTAMDDVLQPLGESQ